MPNALPGNDLLPPSPLLRLTDVQHNGPNWMAMADGPSLPVPDVRSRLDLTA